MLTIRLQRRGRKNDPSFRVILVEKKRAAKTGNYMEMLGSYDARTSRISLDGERIKHWMSMGATVSDNLHNILIKNKVIEGKKINVLPRKSPPKKEGEDAPVAAAVAADVAPAEEEVVAAETIKAAPTSEVGVPTESVGKVGDNAVAAETPTE